MYSLPLVTIIYYLCLYTVCLFNKDKNNKCAILELFKHHYFTQARNNIF